MCRSNVEASAAAILQPELSGMAVVLDESCGNPNSHGLEQFLAQVLAFEPITLLPLIFAPEQGASPMAVP